MSGTPRSPHADPLTERKDATAAERKDMAAVGTTAENIKVYARVRRWGDGEGSCLRVHAETGEITAWRARKVGEPAPAEPLHSFCFDQVGDINTEQADVFEAVGRPIADTALSGFNATVFAYGQTGAGKTFTMFGETNEQRGLAPRMLECLFERMHDAQAEGRFRCRASHLEIYNETLTDLLCTAPAGGTRPPLRLREDTTHGVYVTNATLVDLTSTDQALRALGAGLAARTVGSTAMNGKSSRSHAVFTLHIEQTHDVERASTAQRQLANAVPAHVCRRSQLHLVDLAGSERYNDACTSSARRKEACNINKSLSALGNVMGALVSIAQGQPRHVPYRESKLTMLLRDSLGGGACTHLIANVSASADCLAETISTLKFAQRAKLVRNHATRHEILVTPPSPPQQLQQPSLAQPPAAAPPPPMPLPHQPQTARRQATRAVPPAGSKPARSRLHRAASAPVREEAVKEAASRQGAAAREAAPQEDEVQQPVDAAAEEGATVAAIEAEEVATGAEPETLSESTLQDAQHETRQLIEAMKMRVEVALNTAEPSALTSPPPPPPHGPAEAWATPRATPRLTPRGSTTRCATMSRRATPSQPSSASLGGVPLTTVMRWRAEAAAAEAASRAAQAGRESMVIAHAEALEQTAAAARAVATADSEAEMEAQAEAHAKTLARAAYAESKLREARAEAEAALAQAQAAVAQAEAKAKEQAQAHAEELLKAVAEARAEAAAQVRAQATADRADAMTVAGMEAEAAVSAEARAAEAVAAAEARAAAAEARAAEAERVRLAAEQEVGRVTEDAARKADEQMLAAKEAVAQVKAAWAAEAQEEADAWKVGAVVERGGLRRELCRVTQALADERRRGAELADRVDAAREEAEGAAAAAAEAAAALVARAAPSQAASQAHGQAGAAAAAVAAAAEVAEATLAAQLAQLEGERQAAAAAVAREFALRRQQLEQEEAYATELARADEARVAAVEATQAEWQRAEVLNEELHEARRAADAEIEALRAQLEASAFEVAAAAVDGRGGQDESADASMRDELQASREEVARLRGEVAALGQAARLVERQSEDREAAAAALAAAGNAAVERLSEAEYVALSSAVAAAEQGVNRGASPQRSQGRGGRSSPGSGSGGASGGGEARPPACQRITRLLEQLGRSTSLRGDVRDGVAIGVLLAFEASQADFEAELGPSRGSGHGTNDASARGSFASTAPLVAPRRANEGWVDGVLTEARPRPGAPQPPQPSFAAPRTSTTPPRSRSRQGAAVIARICELGRSGATVETIDASLSREGFRTSTGTPWPSRNDGRVVVRTLLRHGLQPISHDAKVASYAAEWAAKMLGGPVTLPQEQMPPNTASNQTSAAHQRPQQPQQQQPGSPSTCVNHPSFLALQMGGLCPGPDSPTRRALGERAS